MEQIKSNFRFNLIRFFSGGARRLPPLRSVFTLLFSFVFVFCSCLVPSSAAMVQPDISPVIGSSAAQVQQFVGGLTPDQLEIFYLLSGSQAISYTGFGNYELSTEFQNTTESRNWVKEFGEKFYTDLFLGSIGVPSSVAQPVLDLFQGNAQYASGVTTDFNTWASALNSSPDPFYMPISPALVSSLNQSFAQYGGLYDWQSIDENLLTMQNFSWVRRSMNSSAQASFDTYFQYNPVIFNSMPGQAYNCFLFNNVNTSWLPSNLTLFFDLSRNTAYLTTNGSTSWSTTVKFWVLTATDDVYVSGNTTLSNKQFNFASYPSVGDAFNYILSHPYVLYSRLNTDTDVLNLFGLIPGGVYIGSNWASRQPLFLSGLNIEPNDYSYVLQPLEDLLLDLKGLLADLVDTQELRAPVFDNLYDTEGNLDPDPAVQRISVSLQLPDSGVIVPVGLFGSLTDDGGYIDYLWFMTKPLVQFTKSLVDSFTFDGFDGADPVTGETVHFSGSGPGMIVFGVVSVGLISGFVVKCLL